MRHLPQVTLCAVDTTAKAFLAARAIEKSLAQCSFADVKLLTDQDLPHAVKIPPVNGIAEYSRFVVRELHKYVQTSHCLLVQGDGYVANPVAWSDEFLRYDFAGAPWEQWQGAVGNGGFSLRSKRLLAAGATLAPHEVPHPEDVWLSHSHRPELQGLGMKWMPTDLARRFAFEGRAFTGKEWAGIPTRWGGQFGFHSWLTPLPATMDKPLIFHHSGDSGDVIYSLAAARALGGGVYFFSADNRFPFPRPTRCPPTAAWVDNLAPLLYEQDYIWSALWTHGTPYSTDCDFNAFRLSYKEPHFDNFASILSLHQKRFGVEWPEGEPWLTVRDPLPIAGRPIVVNRTPRYPHPKFPWYSLVQRYGDQMVFVGSEAEAQTFQGMAPPRWKEIPWHRTDNLLDLARVIAGAKVFIGNQSCPLAIAHGLGQKSIIEEWLPTPGAPGNPNCHLKRRDAIYWRETMGLIEIPAAWLT